MCCRYSLEMPHQGTSLSTQNICFHGERRFIWIHILLAGFWAQLDACSTGDQEVEDLIPAGSATFFRGD